MPKIKPLGFAESFEEFAVRFCAAGCNCGYALRQAGVAHRVPHCGHRENCVLWEAYRVWKESNQQLWARITRKDVALRQAS